MLKVGKVIDISALPDSASTPVYRWALVIVAEPYNEEIYQVVALDFLSFSREKIFVVSKNNLIASENYFETTGLGMLTCAARLSLGLVERERACIACRNFCCFFFFSYPTKLLF